MIILSNEYYLHVHEYPFSSLNICFFINYLKTKLKRVIKYQLITGFSISKSSLVNYTLVYVTISKQTYIVALTISINYICVDNYIKKILVLVQRHANIVAFVRGFLHFPINISSVKPHLTINSKDI